MLPYRFLIIILVSIVSQWAYSAEFFHDPKILDHSDFKIYKDIKKEIDDLRFSEKRAREVIKKTNRFIKSEPGFLPAYIELSRATLILGYSGENNSAALSMEALEILEKVQSKDKTYARSWVLAGHIYTLRGEYKKAKESLETAGRYGKTDPWYYLNWERLLEKTNKPDSRIDYLLGALSVVRDDNRVVGIIVNRLGKISSSKLQQHVELDLAEIVFDLFESSDDRLRIANNLTKNNGGSGVLISTAERIISRQLQETPDSSEAIISLAEVTLENGYKYDSGNVSHYSNQSRAAVKKILAETDLTKLNRDRVFKILADIYLNEKNYGLFLKSVDEAKKHNVDRSTVLRKEANYYYATRNYKAVVENFDKLIDIDNSNSHNIIFAMTHLKLGNSTILKNYHLREVERHSTNARANGNAARAFLQHLNDYDKAIMYGEKAISIMRYGNAVNTLTMAYLKKAAKLNVDGDKKEAFSYVEKAIDMGGGFHNLVKDCRGNCDGVEVVVDAYVRGTID